MDDDTEVFRSCSSMLNGEFFMFGGDSQRKQVNLRYSFHHQTLICRSQKLLDVNLNELATWIMIFSEELVGHSIIQKNVSCCAFQLVIDRHVKGKFQSSWIKIILTIFSFDGQSFYNHTDSTHGHYFTSLANLDGSPLAVGGSGPNINKTEIYDIASHTWTEVEDYPYHDL